MSWLDGLRHRLRVVFRPGEFDRDLAEEMRMHEELDAMQQDDPGRARRRIGNRTVHRENTRAETWLRWWDIFRQDGGYAWRSIRRTPGATAMIVVTLALGIGVNAVAFSVLDQLYFRNPPGVADAGGVHRIWTKYTRTENNVPFHSESMTYGMFRMVAEQLGADGQVAVWSQMGGFRLGGTRSGTLTNMSFVSGNYLSLLGVHAALGRLFTEDEARPPNVVKSVVVSHGFWRSRLGGDSTIIGRQVRLGTEDWTVIGVAAEGFTGIDFEPENVWAPLGARPGAYTLRNGMTLFESPFYSVFRAIARIKPRADIADFERRMTTVARASDQARDPQRADTGKAITIGSLIRARGPGETRQEETVATRLQAVALIVLIIACANVVNLMLSRAVTRRRETAVRLALGISRGRLIRLITIEAVLLATIAAAGALAAAWWGAAVLRATLMADVHWAHPALGANVVLVTIVVALGCGLVAGVIPAVQYSRPQLTDDLKEGTRGAAARRSRLRDGLVVAQAALSMVLLVGATLMVRTLRNVEGVSIGFDAGHVFWGQPAFEPGQAPPPAARTAGMNELVTRLSAMPSIAGAARSNVSPMGGFSFWTFWWDADSSASLRQAFPVAYIVTPGYFAATGIRILEGRVFDDGAAGERQVVLNDAMARMLWRSGSAVGKCIRFTRSDAPCTTVVGVASTASRDNIIEEPKPQYYVPLGTSLAVDDGNTLFVARARAGATDVAMSDAAAMVRQVFPTSEAVLTTMDDYLAPKYRPWRLGAQLFTGVGLLALVVALVGIYSTVSYSVGQRRHEFGVRMALGARLRDVLNQVMGEGVRVVLVGIALGVVLTVVTSRLVASLLYGVEPNDISAMILAGSTLTLVAIVAALVPAWRAAQADPMDALRGE